MRVGGDFGPGIRRGQLIRHGRTVELYFVFALDQIALAAAGDVWKRPIVNGRWQLARVPATAFGRQRLSRPEFGHYTAPARR